MGRWPPAKPALGLGSFAYFAGILFFVVMGYSFWFSQRVLLVSRYGFSRVFLEGLDIERMTPGSSPFYLLTNGDSITGEDASQFQLTTVILVIVAMLFSIALASGVIATFSPARRVFVAYARFLKRCSKQLEQDRRDAIRAEEG